jgi:23S rRNA pseudouridine2605 synthase
MARRVTHRERCDYTPDMNNPHSTRANGTRAPRRGARHGPQGASQSSVPLPHALPGEPESERVQKYLAHAGVASRRHAEELIEAGMVTINGVVVRELGARVVTGRDEVRVRGRLVRPAREGQCLYILLNKPIGPVTTSSDERGRRTVLDLLPDEWRARRVYPVGRLDRDTEGLLLLTDDGTLALRLTHPRYALEKEYHALVAGHPAPEVLERLASGVLLAGEARPTAPANVRVLRREGANTWVVVAIHEGRNRQVRRMLEAEGHPVLRLRRVRVGPLTLGALEPGQSRLLTALEVAALRGEHAGADVPRLQDDAKPPR